MKRTPLENWIIDRTGIQERSKNALEAYQVTKVRETVEYVKKNSLFYREQLKAVETEDIRSQKDVQSLPFTFPQDIRENPHGFLCVPQREVKRIVTLNTSGTTGEGKRIFFTEEDLDYTIDFFRYGMSCLTDHRDRVLVLLPGSAYGSIGDLLKKALAMSNIACTVHGVLRDPEEAAKCIEEENITCIVGIPIQVLYLSRVKREVFKSRIKKVLLSTEYVPDVLIRELMQKCECKVFTHYGMTEMGYGGGVECDALNGHHIREGDLYFEIINPDTGEPVENGEYGEVVFTTLNRQAMPLIRYRTGDLAVYSVAACSCGTFLKTMKKVLGRIDNRVKIGENQFLYLRELDEILLSFEEIMDYKAGMNIEDRLVVEITTQHKGSLHRIKDEVEISIQEILRRKLGYGMNIEIGFNQENKPTKIANSMIKRKFVIAGKDDEG